MFRTALVLLLVIGCATAAFGQSSPHAPAPGYQPKLTYPGIYKADRLYQFNVYDQTWYATKAPKLWDKLRCSDARLTLLGQGEWQGCLTEAGDCAGLGEGQRWGTGNYLNFLATGRPADAASDK